VRERDTTAVWLENAPEVALDQTAYVVRDLYALSVDRDSPHVCSPHRADVLLTGTVPPTISAVAQLTSRFSNARSAWRRFSPWSRAAGLEPSLHATRETLCGQIDRRVQTVGGGASTDARVRHEVQGHGATVASAHLGVGRLEANPQAHATASEATDGREHPILDVGPSLGPNLESLRVDGYVQSDLAAEPFLDLTVVRGKGRARFAEGSGGCVTVR
jgi:hypothetical protein